MLKILAIVIDLLFHPVTMATIAAVPLLAGLVLVGFFPRIFVLIIKNLRRNILRTVLTCVATFFLVGMVTLIWTVISFLDAQTTEKAADIKLIVTERWQIPSQLPPTHAHYLDPDNAKFLPELKEHIKPGNFMTWSFYGGSIDPTKMSPDYIVFLFSMDPQHIIPMMEDMSTFDPKLVAKLKQTRNGCLLGPERLAKIGKRVGERFKITSFNYKGIDLEFEIVGELPAGRYGLSGIMNVDYFNDELDRYAREKRTPHPFDQKRLNLIWLRVPDRPTFEKVGGIIETATIFADRPVKVETAPALVGNFLDSFKDLLFGVKYLLVPAILATMALVVSNSISISVRERRTEMAVLKVLGFRPGQILILVLGEALLVAGLMGLATSVGTWALVNLVMGGVPFPIAFFPKFLVPTNGLLWGMAIGFGTAFLGAIVPAWTARSVKVSEVFSKVA